MDSIFPMPSEELRKKLLKEEFKLRKKQPEHWAKTKYRKYARPFKEAPTEKIYAEEPHEVEKAEKAAKKVSTSKKKPVKKKAGKHKGKKAFKKKK